jgi:3-oxoacyl-[acyl-carrier protein] reductase
LAARFSILICDRSSAASSKIHSRELIAVKVALQHGVYPLPAPAHGANWVVVTIAASFETQRDWGVGSRTRVNVMSRLSTKVAIVTGASKGIGGGIAIALGAAGARVVVNYASDREGAERVAGTITDNGGEAIAVRADVSKAADVVRLFEEVDSVFGRLDVLVNNAGVFRFGALGAITEESFHLHYNTNVLGAILTVQEAVKRFGVDGGSIINLSSIVASHPVAGVLLYASSKGAIETLTRGLAIELAPRKIRVNAIAPGHTETEGNATAGTFDGGAGAVLAGKTPMGRLGRVADIAPLAVFLASDESAWITGEVIRAAGGLVAT